MGSRILPRNDATRGARDLTGSERPRQQGDLILRAGVDDMFDAHFETLKGFPGLGRTFFMQVGGEF